MVLIIETGRMMQTQNITEPAPSLDRNQVAVKAYQLWEQAGRPVGRDLDFWLLAEAQCLAKPQSAPDPQTPAPSEFTSVRTAAKTLTASPRVTTPKLGASRAASNKKRKTSI